MGTVSQKKGQITPIVIERRVKTVNDLNLSPVRRSNGINNWWTWINPHSADIMW